jgi:hypothetical protein
MPDELLLRFPVAFALTLAVETPLVAFSLARWYRVAAGRAIAAGAVASAVTHPIVWFVLPDLLTPPLGVLAYLLVAEGFAWLVETAVFWLAVRRDVPGLLLLSLLANLASFTVGMVLQRLGIW